MGLDMYLESRKNGEIFYWRKANAIHNFFEQQIGPIENCVSKFVPKKIFKELYERCEKVIISLENSVKVTEKIWVGTKLEEDPTTQQKKVIKVYSDVLIYEDKETATELLPTTSGFFFGSTDYDDYYLQDIKNTKKICFEILNDPRFKNDKIKYHAWW